jgi:hypothetical protein
MKWVIFVMLSNGSVQNADYLAFTSYTECNKIASVISTKKQPRSCFTANAQFKNKVKHESSTHINRTYKHSK